MRIPDPARQRLEEAKAIAGALANGSRDPFLGELLVEAAAALMKELRRRQAKLGVSDAELEARLVARATTDRGRRAAESLRGQLRSASHWRARKYSADDHDGATSD